MYDETQPQPPPPYAWAAATFGVIMVLYWVTLAPTTAFWDTSEYIAAAKVLGIPHPPGNPLFTLTAHAWGLIPWAEDYARRINLFAAVTSAGGAAIWFLVAERWLRNILAERGPRLAASFAGVFASATAWTVWSQSTVNEKVYTVSLLSIAMICWCAIRWADEPVGARRDRWLVLAVYLLALGTTNHMMGALGAPVVGIYILMTDWRVLTRPKFLAACAAVAILGVSLNYAYLPLRAAQYPPINEGEPVGFNLACALSAGLTQCSTALSDVIGRVQYGKPSVTLRQSDFVAQLAMYWEYWGWQWGRELGALKGLATGLFTVLGLGGLWTMIKRDRRAGLSAAALVFTLTLLLIYYLNFKYGFSYHNGDPGITDAQREVRERDYFFLASFAFAGVVVAAGFAAGIRVIGEWLGDRVPADKRALAGTPLLALALLPLIGNYRTAPRSGETIARDFAIDMLESIEPYGILITAGDNDTFPLWFAQEVLGVRRDVTLANLSLMNTDWHLRQIRRRESVDFDPATAAKIWRPTTDQDSASLGLTATTGWRNPKTPAFAASIAALDSLGEFMQVRNRTLQFDSVIIELGQDVLTRSDVAALLLIKDNLGKRPIYFSWSDGPYPDQALGLAPYLLSQGMVRKVMPAPLKVGGTVQLSPFLGYVDLERSRRLLFETYHPEAAAKPRPFGWVDPPSASIPGLYGLIYNGYATVLREAGDTVHANRADSLTQVISRQINRGTP